jgi:hypothetical protein
MGGKSLDQFERPVTSFNSPKDPKKILGFFLSSIEKNLFLLRITE